MDGWAQRSRQRGCGSGSTIPPELEGIAGLEWIFDQSNLGVDESLVEVRTDLSDEGNDGTAAGAARPQVLDTVWASKAVFFDGADDALEHTMVSIGTGPFTLGLCAYFVFSGSICYLLRDDASATGGIRRGPGTDVSYWNGSGVITIADPGSLPNATKMSLVVRRDSSANLTARKDGVDITSAGTPNDATALQWDRWTHADSVPSFHCPARMLASSFVTGADLTSLESWLGAIRDG